VNAGRDGLLSRVVRLLEHVARPRWRRRRGLSERMLQLNLRYSLGWRYVGTHDYWRRARP
jgi:hypothetical protein